MLETDLYRYAGFEWILFCLALTLPFATDLAILGGAYRGVLQVSRAMFAEAGARPTIRPVAVVVLFIVGWRLWAVTAATMPASLLAATFLALRARADFAPEESAATNWLEAIRVIRFPRSWRRRSARRPFRTDEPNGPGPSGASQLPLSTGDQMILSVVQRAALDGTDGSEADAERDGWLGADAPQRDGPDGVTRGTTSYVIRHSCRPRGGGDR